jgi:hypothetical protein
MVIAFDFDWTVACGGWPDITKAKLNKVVADWLKKRKRMGDQLVMWTCRENFFGDNFDKCEGADGIDRSTCKYLDEAVEFCRKNGIAVDNVNMAIGEQKGDVGIRYGRKIMAKFYLDDSAVPFNPRSKFAPVFWWIFLKLVDIRLATMVI